MADLTIAQLTELLAIDVDNADLLPIWDDTASETKKISIAQITTLFGLTNWSEAFITGTQDTSQWTPNNAAANVNAALTPKGTGAIVGQAPNGTITGGNARGQYAVDFQLARNAANQVSSGSYSFIGSGANNRNIGDYSGLLSGYGNYLVGVYSFLGGGYNNSNQSSYAVIGGGENNYIELNNNYTVIGGGFTNATGETATYATIGGGSNNTIIRTYGTISGGLSNYISGNFTAIAGGQSNTAQGAHSFIGGGHQNTTSANYTAAMGRRAAAGNIGAFVWADSTDAQYNDNGVNTFNVRATGGAYFTQYGYFGGRIDIQALASTAGLLRIFSNNGTNFVGFQAPNGISANYTYTLPTSYGSNGQVLTSNGSGTLSWSTAGGLTNWTEAFSSATQATSSFTATNAATDVNAAIVPKGTGALIGATPDGGFGGNARGQYAVDLQLSRSTSNKVASANYSGITSGANNAVSGTYSNILGGSTNEITQSFSSLVGGNANTVVSVYSFMGGGNINTISGGATSQVLCGGSSNTNSNNFAFLGGGQSNTISGEYGSLIGGLSNTVSGGYGGITSGLSNTSGIQGGIVGGGQSNTVYGYGFIGGGHGNVAGSATPIATGNSNITSGSTTVSWVNPINTGQLIVGTGIPAGTYVVSVGTPNMTLSQAATQTGTVSISAYHSDMVVCGGVNNTASFTRCFVGGGSSNTAGSGLNNATVGGLGNTTGGGGYNFVGGGFQNSATGNYDVVVGGYQNYVSGTDNGNYRFIGGGFQNQMGTQTNGAVVVGGYNNAYGLGSQTFMGGGLSNSNSGSYNVITGGRQNSISGSRNYVTMAGGYLNTISVDNGTIGGGQSNTVSGQYANIKGGLQAVASLYGQSANASGSFSTVGDAQAHELIWRRAVTGSSITEIFLDGTSVAAILPSTNCLWQGTIEIAAFCSDTGDGTTPLGNAQGTTYKVTIKRLGATTSLVGTVQEIGVMNNDPTVVGTFTIDANDTNESLRIQFTPPATAGSTTVHRVVATFRGLQIQY
jgi:hypothetical protein